MKIAIGNDRYGYWHERFAAVLDRKIKEGKKIEYRIVSLEGHDWIRNIEDCDVVVWKTDYMGAEAATYFKEKIYFIEHYLKKIVIPNYNSVWHFESKIAQSYLFEKYNIKSPKTVASFDYYDALEELKTAKMPLVIKLSHGAGSKNVSMVSTRKAVQNMLLKTFCHQLWKIEKKKHGISYKLFLNFIFKKWFWYKIAMTIFKQEKFRACYWQEFIAGNKSDLRITVIGDKYAFGFYRKNRPGDFRASGGGLIDYDTEIPEDVVKYCININKKLSFDSMAYDILFTENGFVIVEMSYGYVDTAIYNARGYYELVGDTLTFNEGHFWPQQMWFEWILLKQGVK